MFDVERFIDDCRKANAEADSHKAVLELVERTCSDPAAVLAGLGEPARAGAAKLYHSDRPRRTPCKSPSTIGPSSIWDGRSAPER